MLVVLAQSKVLTMHPLEISIGLAENHQYFKA
jgi:hypothetical protein